MSTFNPTPAEMALTSSVFGIADPQKLGIITGDTAVKVLSGANLSNAVLGEIWAIADKENNGFLTRKGVAIALRLIGHAQKGEPVNEELLSKAGPLANIDGVPGLAVAGSPAPTSVPGSPPSNQGSTLPPVTQQDKAKFLKLFIGCGPSNGLLSGEKARDVFVKSKLPYEKLSQIWTLADTKARGALDSTDFTIGMYLIQASMSSNSFILPATLPSWVYDQAVQKDATAAVPSHTTGSSTSGLVSPLQSFFQVPKQYTGSSSAGLNTSAIKSQYTGQGQTFSQIPSQITSTVSSTSPVSLPAVNVPSRGFQTQSEQWDISVEAKRTSDQYFDSLDTQRRGYIEGAVAVPFMLESKLPEDDLARIWDLSDLYNDGRLTREGFAVAMHLINSRLAGTQIPVVLPASLVPPSMRQAQSSMGATIEPQQDLLGDDTPPGTPVPSPPSGGNVVGPSSTSSIISNHLTGQGGIQRAFQPSRQPPAFLPAVNKDLLGDDDDEASKGNPVPDNSVELGNLQNQVASTTRSHATTQAERISTEQTVTRQASQLSQLQSQLSAAKASYEIESRLLASLRERLAAQRVDIQNTQEELIRAESELSATKMEKAEVEGSVLRDKEEIRELQRKMKDIADETDNLKSNVEKAKRDARQQKGLLAIAKKQLATAEAEKLKINKELDVAQKEFDTASKERENLDAHVAGPDFATPSLLPEEIIRTDGIGNAAPSILAAAIPLPATPQPINPRPAARRHSTNPFERLAMGSIPGSGHLPPPTSFPSHETLKSETMALSSDPFGLPGIPPDPITPQPLASEPSVTEDYVEISKSDINPVLAMDPESSPPLALSPSDNDLPFLTPPSTATHMDQGSGTPTYQGAQSFPGASLSGIHDDVLKPLQEVQHDASDTSDSEDEALNPKISTKETTEQLGADISSLPATSNEPVVNVGSPPQPNFDDSFSSIAEPTVPPVAMTTSSSTSGTSSPKRNRSPGRAISTRTLSSHSISGAIDLFGAPAFSTTPLEPPAREAAPPPTIETVLEPNTNPTNTSSINDLDEAFGKMPGPARDPAATFRFDSTFDDNFDFTSALHENSSASVAPPNETGFGNLGFETGTSPSVSGTGPKSQPTASTGPGSFGEVFSQFSPVNGGHDPSVSFDEAFGLSTIEQPHTNGQLATSNGDAPFNNAVTSGGGSQKPPVATGNPFPLPSPPSLPTRTQPSPPPAREASPPIRPASPHPPRAPTGASKVPSPPPRRTSSPRLRLPSKSSSENKPDAPPKHKLSIRFPFGRKDKAREKEDKRAQSQAHSQLLEQQQFLSPAPEPQSPGNLTPAVDDDAEPVKQLAAMGFSRTQSIAALETYGYDMQKALNSLLGAA